VTALAEVAALEQLPGVVFHPREARAIQLLEQSGHLRVSCRGGPQQEDDGCREGSDLGGEGAPALHDPVRIPLECPHLVGTLLGRDGSAALQPLLRDRPDEARLAPEALVDRLDRHVRRLGDGCDRRSGVATAVEQLPCDLEDGLAGAKSLTTSSAGVVLARGLDRGPISFHSHVSILQHCS